MQPEDAGESRESREAATTRLAAKDIAALDPYKFTAVIGKGVIHPGGRASTESLLARAGSLTAEGRALVGAVLGHI